MQPVTSAHVIEDCKLNLVRHVHDRRNSPTSSRLPLGYRLAVGAACPAVCKTLETALQLGL
jgi:hypothetical protein